MFLVTYFGCSLFAGFRTRWNDPVALLERIIPIVLWLGWLVHLWWRVFTCCRFGRQKPRLTLASLVTLLIGMIAFVFAVKAGGLLGARARLNEIRHALDAGLYEDSVKLMKDWPFTEQRVYSSDVLFSQLPQSIRLLRPVFVEIEQSDINGPANLGICKNGFGGFAVGVRIFFNDTDAELLQIRGRGTGEKVADGAYYWWQHT